MKKTFTLLLLLILTTSLCACGSKKEYYSDSYFENIYSFAGFTDAEETGPEYSDFAEAHYTYENASNEDITKYTQYLTDKCGLEFEDLTSSYLNYSFSKDDKKVLGLYIPKDTNQVCIDVLLSDSKSEELKEESYQKIVSAFKDENYKEIVDGYKYSSIDTYKDTSKYINYSKGMLAWDFENGIGAYSLAIESFNNAQGLEDAADKASQLSAEVSAYNGTYQYKQGEYLTYYLFVKDGKVAKELSSTLSANTYTYGNPVWYYSDLMKLELTPDAISALGGQVPDTMVKTLVVGRFDNLKFGEPEKEYLFMEVDDGSMALLNMKKNSIASYSGIYTKISNDAPPAK